jgi:hypothetical protein
MSDRADMIPQVMTRLLQARSLAHAERRPGAAVAATKALAEFLQAKLTAAEIPPEPLTVVLKRFIVLEDENGNFRRDEAGNLEMEEWCGTRVAYGVADAVPEPSKPADDVTDDLAQRVLEQLEAHGLVPGDDADAMECILALLNKHEAADVEA